MASIKPATRYSNSLNSSTKSDPFSSTELTASRAITKKTTNNQINLSSMVKKLVDNKKAKNFSKDSKFIVADDFLAQDLKKNAKKGAGLSGLHKKLFKGSSGGAKRGDESSKNALTEVKGNTRTLGMVLRSERELLSLCKENEEQMAELKLLLEEKNREVEKLKDLCLKQREEMKSLKNAVLFPDVMNSQLEKLLEKQGSELNQAKHLIPSLQKQVTSLTGQLQCLAEDLEEVKADKYSAKGSSDNHFSSPRTPSCDQEEAANSWFDQEFSSGDYTTPDIPDDMFLKDLNPCLTPCYSKTKPKDFEVYDSQNDDGLSRNNMQMCHGTGFNSHARKLSKSSDCCHCSKTGNSSVRSARQSDESKCTYGKQLPSSPIPTDGECLQGDCNLALGASMVGPISLSPCHPNDTAESGQFIPIHQLSTISRVPDIITYLKSLNMILQSGLLPERSKLPKKFYVHLLT
ncbi:unnamed protein product [Fraxinus pennsylvanica]|uniref:Uncharacterized protein n=1 Tax=Fraxinus pennsylvanica TaxID=56036 RepID=A0AAD2EDQ9_9LAMI|nr:unnamed protein product [Fraxinus pennsylvanica]